MSELPTLTIPLRVCDDGSIRVGKSRVLLELVVDAFDRGETVDGIVDMYSTLESQDVYAVIAYYLANTKTVRKYMRARARQANEVRRYFEERMTPEDKALLERMRTVRSNQEAAHDQVSAG